MKFYCSIKLKKERVLNDNDKKILSKLDYQCKLFINKNCNEHTFKFEDSYYYLCLSFGKTKKISEQECSKKFLAQFK